MYTIPVSRHKIACSEVSYFKMSGLVLTSACPFMRVTDFALGCEQVYISSVDNWALAVSLLPMSV